jgi:hypothetical protein
MTSSDMSKHTLCAYFLSGYVSKQIDYTNLAPDQFPGVLDRYERLFRLALKHLGMTKESLRKKSEFNFDSGNATNLESGIAVLRTVELLHQEGFSKIALVDSEQKAKRADIACEKAGRRVCIEVKAVTKQSSGRKGYFLEDQLYEKIRESTPKARKQLEATASALNCSVKILAFVVNWFAQSIYLCQSDYKRIVDRLEMEHDGKCLVGIDGVFFITSAGVPFWFLKEVGKSIDVRTIGSG